MNKLMANCFKTLFLLIFLILISGSILNAQTKMVLLKGDIVGRKSEMIYLFSYTTSRVTYAKKIEIPIKDNSFKYVLEVDTMIAYKFIFKDELENGAYNEIIFFPDTNEVNFTLYDLDNSKNNLINGGRLNESIRIFEAEKISRFKIYQDELNNKQKELQSKNLYYNEVYIAGYNSFKKARVDLDNKRISSDEYYKLLENWGKIQNSKESRTVLGQNIDYKKDSLDKEIIKWKYDYLSKNVNLASFLLINNDFNNRTVSNPFLIEKLKLTVPIFAKAFPNHPYTKLVQDKLNAITKVSKGNLFVDILAKDIKSEKEVKLSSLIKAEYTLIDLWGSWCGPCIAKTKTMKPIYEKYKNSGFDIIGIAREFKSLKAVKNRINIENYVWTNLYDLDDKYGIWDKYGIGNGAGLMVLVDNKGKILAVDPTAEEVEKIISVNQYD